MVILKQNLLPASFFSLGWALGSEEVLQDEDLKRIIDCNWDVEQAVFRKLDSPSAYNQILWKNEKSTPPSSLTYESAENEVLLDVCTLVFFFYQIYSNHSSVRRHRNHLSSHQPRNLQKHDFHLHKVLNIPLTINSSLLDPEDIDTAFSSPNAILGSPSFSPHSTLPRFFVSFPVPAPLPPLLTVQTTSLIASNRLVYS